MISRWPDSDRMRIGSYVASLDLRNLKVTMHTSAKTLSASSQKSSDGAIRQLLGVDRIRDPKRRSASSGESLISTLLSTCGECSTLPVRIPRRGQHFVR